MKLVEGEIRHAEVAIGKSFLFSFADFLGNAQVSLLIHYCLLKVFEGVFNSAQIAIGNSFSGSVTDVLDNA